MIKRVMIALLAGIFFSAAPICAEENHNFFKPDNHCHDPGSWEGWEELVRKYPDDLSLQVLHALRIGLCAKIDQGSISLEAAIQIFDDAHQLVIQQAKSQHEKKGPSL